MLKFPININLKNHDKFAGTGTFGRVVLCRHHGTPLALKILSMVDVIRLKQVEHLRNEITILKEVKHPFIVNMQVSYPLLLDRRKLSPISSLEITHDHWPMRLWLFNARDVIFQRSKESDTFVGEGEASRGDR